MIEVEMTQEIENQFKVVRSHINKSAIEIDWLVTLLRPQGLLDDGASVILESLTRWYDLYFETIDELHEHCLRLVNGEDINGMTAIG